MKNGFYPLVIISLCLSSCLHERLARREELTSPSEVTIKETQPQTKGETAIIEWIENDYELAVKRSIESKKPLLIDMWADWCHTCLAMKNGVLLDPKLASYASEFIWLAVDTEDPASSDAMTAFPPKVWPTFYVLSPKDQSVQATQIGSCSTSEFLNFLNRGAKGISNELLHKEKSTTENPLPHLQLADRASLQQNFSVAAKEYELALTASPKNWAYRAPTLKNQIAALSRLDDKKECAQLGLRKLEEMVSYKNSASTDFMYFAGLCTRKTLGNNKKHSFKKILSAFDQILAAPQTLLSNDDRSDALLNSRFLAKELGDRKRERAYAIQQKTLLFNAIKNANTASEEMIYVWHQVELYSYLNQGEDILPWVESLEKRLPKEYDPPYRKAWLLSKMGRNADSLIALERALTLARGPRKGNMYELQANIYKAQGKKNKERTSWQHIIDHYHSLPAGQKDQQKIERAMKAIAELAGSTPVHSPEL